MAIEVECSCGKKLKAPDSAAGRRGKCPACGNAVAIPLAVPEVDLDEMLGTGPPPDSKTVAAAAPPAKQASGRTADDDDEYRIAALPPPLSPPVPKMPAPVVPSGPDKVCPSCGRRLPSNTKLCIGCGIDLQSGRSLITSRSIDKEELYGNVDRVVSWISWIMPLAFFPIASDAYGRFRPTAIRALVALIIVVSSLNWIVGLTDGRAASEPLGPWPDILLWAGSQPNLLLIGFEGEFHCYQLLTNTFLHADIFHLGGNMVFLLVFGQAINAVLGQWKTIVIYLFLAVAASLAFLISQSGEPMIPALGASGAIMGLAGMYFILLPASRVHMIAWLRLGFLTGFRRFTKYFVVRGFAVLLFYIAFDVAAAVFGWRDGTAHWAHLGGFICGAILALVLLLTRQVNMRGADMISVLLGRHAWKLLGAPANNADAR